MTYLLFIITLLLSSSNCKSWTNWFSSSSDEQKQSRSGSEFSIHALISDDPKGMKLAEKAKNSLAIGNGISSHCWQSAYRRLLSGCSTSLAMEEKRSRFAWHLSDCFQRDSGRSSSFPYCDEKSPMKKCLQTLDDHAHRVYLEFYLETNSICHHLQAHAFKHETERLVNELKSSAEFAEEKLERIEQKTGKLLEDSSQIHDSLSSIDIRTQQVGEAARELGDKVGAVLRLSDQLHEQSRKLVESQGDLKEGQTLMKNTFEQGMSAIEESYGHLGREIGNLRNEASMIEKEIGRVGDTMSSKMKILQSKADEIGSVAGDSLDKQQQLLDGQSVAMRDLQFLTRFQSEALEESRSTLQKLVEYGHMQQEELLQRQKQLQELHDHLMDKSRSILAAQESFESKQATMFAALDKLFALHSALVLESRLIKAFFIYFMMIFVIYMFTSTKQTYNIRPWLYIGLCVTLCIEVAILRFTSFDIEQQTRAINMLRLSFALIALVQLIHAIFTYRDYEVLNYNMLQTLIEKVDFMQRRELSDEADTEISWPSWIEVELPEDVNKYDDPDFKFPEEFGENSIVTSSILKRYDLRQRNHR